MCGGKTSIGVSRPVEVPSCRDGVADGTARRCRPRPVERGAPAPPGALAAGPVRHPGTHLTARVVAGLAAAAGGTATDAPDPRGSAAARGTAPATRDSAAAHGAAPT